MSYRVSVSSEAEKILDRVDRVMERRLRARFEQLVPDPFDPHLSSPLVERPGVHKSRVGGWRILFTVDRAAQVIRIATIDTRGQVYKHSR